MLLVCWLKVHDDMGSEVVEEAGYATLDSDFREDDLWSEVQVSRECVRGGGNIWDVCCDGKRFLREQEVAFEVAGKPPHTR